MSQWSEIKTNHKSRFPLSRAVNAATYAPAHAVDELVPTVVDKDNGGLITSPAVGSIQTVTQGDLDSTVDQVAIGDDAGTSCMDNTNHAVNVNVVAGGGAGGGTSMADDAAFTPGTTAITPVGGTYRSVLDSVNDNDGGAFAMTQTRAMHVNLRDATGAEVTLSGGDASAAKQDTGNASLASIDGKITAVNTGAVVVASSALPTGAANQTKQDTGNTSLASIDGKITAVNTGAVVLAAGSAAFGKLASNTGVTIGAVEIAAAQTLATVTTVGTVTTITNAVTVNSHAVTNAGTFAVQGAGDVAHDGVDSGSPVKVGFQARTTNPAAVADADRVNGIADKLGRQVITLGQVRGLKIKNTITLTSTTETTLLAAAASTFHDITKIMVSNTSATAVRVDFRDDTAGTVMFSIYAPAGQVVGIACADDPIEQSTVNKNWTAQLSAGVTDVRIFAQAHKNL